MSVLNDAGVRAAMIVVALAWLAVITALAHYALARLQRAEQDINGVGAKAEAVKQQVGAGAGAVGAPVWLQSTDLLPSGLRPALWGQECGEECVSMVVQAVHGVPTTADTLRVLYRGPQGGALTGPDDLVALMSLCNVRSIMRAVPVSDLAAVVRMATDRGRFVIALGYWVSPRVLHWCLVHNSSLNGWTANDPLRGLVNDAWAWVVPRYSGQIVEITQGRDPIVA